MFNEKSMFYQTISVNANWFYSFFLFMIDTNEKRFRKKLGDVLKRQQSDQRDENNRSPQMDHQHIEKCPQPGCPFKSFIT